MITLKLKDAVRVDTLPDRVLARANRSQVSLTVGKYTVIDFVKVKASGNITNDWYGVAVEAANGDQFVVGIATMLGIGMYQENGEWKDSVHPKRKFKTTDELKAMFGKEVEVTGFEKLKVQKFNSEETQLKDFPTFK